MPQAAGLGRQTSGWTAPEPTRRSPARQAGGRSEARTSSERLDDRHVVAVDEDAAANSRRAARCCAPSPVSACRRSYCRALWRTPAFVLHAVALGEVTRQSRTRGAPHPFGRTTHERAHAHHRLVRGVAARPVLILHERLTRAARAGIHVPPHGAATRAPGRDGAPDNRVDGANLANWHQSAARRARVQAPAPGTRPADRTA
jgi:hypothetical protein